MRAATLACALASAWVAAGTDVQKPFAPSIPSDSDAPSYREELLRLHKDLVSTASVSGTEEDVGHFVSKYLRDLGYEVQVQEVAPRENTPRDKKRFNVIAGRAGDGFKPKVLVTSHIDVVPPHIPYEIEDGPVSRETRIKGRGSVDAKGSVAAQITAVEELVRAGEADANQLLLAFVVGEEVSGDGMRALSDALARREVPYYQFQTAVFGEPTDNKLACGHKGALVGDVKVKGFGGHSGYPWLGKSANELLIRALVKLLDTDLGHSDLFGNTTVNVGRIDGGVAGNVIPEDAKAKLMVRVAIGPDEGGSDLVKERIVSVFNEIDDEAFTLEFSQGYGSIECLCDIDGFDKITTNYGTDIPILEGPYKKYLFGPGSILVAHGARENLTVGDLETAVEGFQKIILHALKH